MTADAARVGRPATPHPMVREDGILTEATAREHVESGTWGTTTLRQVLSRAASQWPERPAVVVPSRPGAPRQVVTYAELDLLAGRVAAGLVEQGVGPGDVVAVMLPNGAEAAAVIFAINAVGAVYTGVPVAYGGRESAAILRQSGARTLVLAATHGRRDLLGQARALREQLPDLRDLVVVGGQPGPAPGEVAFDRFTREPAPVEDRSDPRVLAHIGFTSGTTGSPKGVMNTSQTLLHVIGSWLEHVTPQAIGDPPVNLVASPVGHHTGFVWGVLLTALTGGTAVHLPRWDAGHAADVIVDERVTTLFGAPTFVLDLLGAGRPGDTFSSLRTVVVAGAPVPRSLPARVAEQWGAFLCPAWGMTEYAIGVSCRPDRPDAAHRGDGFPVGACEVRVVDGRDQPVGAGAEGALQIRGPGLFLGYYRNREASRDALTADGWFRTGDNAVRHPDGLLALTGRTKDIVIRGGENIPVVEVESVLFEHPDVVEVALVGVPDDRLGERVVACVVPAAGTRPRLADLTAFLGEHGVATHYWPEELRLLERLPKTPSGKIRKLELRTTPVPGGDTRA